mgnify:CR=1 FL=1
MPTTAMTMTIATVTIAMATTMVIAAATARKALWNKVAEFEAPGLNSRAPFPLRALVQRPDIAVQH